jgi:hypothetical protein
MTMAHTTPKTAQVVPLVFFPSAATIPSLDALGDIWSDTLNVFHDFVIP